MKVIPASEARNNFQEVIDAVHYQGKQIIISKRGKPWVVIKPMNELDMDFSNLSDM